MYTVTAADLRTDRKTILRLWSDNFVHATAARYDWLYDRRALGDPACVLLKGPADDAVGINTLLPRSVLWHGSERTIGQAVDLAIDRAHRAAGPAIHLQRGLLARATECDMPAVYGFPLPSAEAVLRRVGYRTLGPFRPWVKYLDCDAGRGPNRPSLLRAVGRCLNGRLLELRHPLPSGWRTETCTAFDERFDRLWRDAAEQFDLLGDRGAAFLEARFLASPKGGYRVFCIADREHRLQGYVVYMARKVGVAKVADALASSSRRWATVMAAFVRHARREGFSRIEFPLLAPAWLEQSLSRVGFRARRTDGRRANNNVVLYQPQGATPMLAAHETVLMTYADTDAD